MPVPVVDESKTPAASGYRMPAEWERHAATWLAWPHNEEDWPGKFAPIPWIYADIVRLIAAGERVHIFVQSAEARRGVLKILRQNDVDVANVTLIVQATDRVWTRDSGPIFIKRAATRQADAAADRDDVRILDWHFNAWAKYKNWINDDQLPAVIAKRLGLPAIQPMGINSKGKRQRFVLEGGSIDVNGAGCVLTTEECLLSPIQQRNPGMTRQVIERALCDYLGVSQVLWLDCGIAGDDTHGHIDDTARFVAADKILTCVAPNRNDPNHAPMKENRRRLGRMRDARGKAFTVIDLPLPKPVYFDKQRLPASYANFYICNAGVLVPVFNDPNDVAALKIIEECFPERPIVPVYCRDLVWGLGTLHCMTQQQPA